MKDLGFKQDSYFEWKKYKWGWNVSKTQKMEDELDYCSAYLVAELGEILNKLDYPWYSNGENECHIIWNKPMKVDYAKADNEANARAKMLIYLVENKLI